MPIIEVAQIAIGQVGVSPNNYKMYSTDNLATVVGAGYLQQGTGGFFYEPNDIIDIVYSASGTPPIGTNERLYVTVSGGLISLSTGNSAGAVSIPTVAGDFSSFSNNSGAMQDSGFNAASFVLATAVIGTANGGTGLPVATVTNGTLFSGAGSAGTLTQLAPGGNGTILQYESGTTGGIAPAALVAGAGIGITNVSGTITIAASGGGDAWSTVTGSTQAMAVEHGYVANKGTLVTFTLPATAVVGDVVKVRGLGAGGWSIVFNSGQFVQCGSTAATTTTGSVSSLNQFDGVDIRCTVTNTTWTWENVIGNPTVA